jgi:hypothetical protein
MPTDRSEPTKAEADRALGYMITGNLVPVTVNTTTASGGGAANSITSAATGTSTSTASTAPEPEKAESWWTRTRKRGAILALFAIGGATAGIANWLGGHPFA